MAASPSMRGHMWWCSHLCWLLVVLFLVQCDITTSFVPVAPTTSYQRSSSFFLAAETTATTTTAAGSEKKVEASSSSSSTVETIQCSSGACITLVGTAHLSQASNDEVARIMEEVQPTIVMVELDPSRLARIGYDTMEELPFAAVATAEGILPPSQRASEHDPPAHNTPWWDGPQTFAKNAMLDTITAVIRQLLTGMYNTMADQMKSEEGPGGEFKMAIEAGRKNGATRLVLGDQASTTTIRRTVELAMESGNPWDVLEKLNHVNSELMEQLETRVRKELEEEKKKEGEEEGAEGAAAAAAAAGVVVDPSEVSVAMMETLKTDTNFRTRLFEKLEQEVPAFTQAFIIDRDYIMAEAIRKELDPIKEKGKVKVVGVVGLAHVPGMKARFEQMIVESSL